jgi:hypothetical protein
MPLPQDPGDRVQSGVLLTEALATTDGKLVRNGLGF